MTILNVVDWFFFLVLPLITGFLLGLLIRHGRFVVDKNLTWEKKLYEQVEDLITFSIAFGLGGLAMYLLGIVYLGWYLVYFAQTYSAVGLVEVLSAQPMLVVVYWSVLFAGSHILAWAIKQPGRPVDIDELRSSVEEAPSDEVRIEIGVEEPEAPDRKKEVTFVIKLTITIEREKEN